MNLTNAISEIHEHDESSASVDNQLQNSINSLDDDLVTRQTGSENLTCSMRFDGQTNETQQEQPPEVQTLI